MVRVCIVIEYGDIITTNNANLEINKVQVITELINEVHISEWHRLHEYIWSIINDTKYKRVKWVLVTRVYKHRQVIWVTE